MWLKNAHADKGLPIDFNDIILLYQLLFILIDVSRSLGMNSCYDNFI